MASASRGGDLRALLNRKKAKSPQDFHSVQISFIDRDLRAEGPSRAAPCAIASPPLSRRRSGSRSRSPRSYNNKKHANNSRQYRSRSPRGFHKQRRDRSRNTKQQRLCQYEDTPLQTSDSCFSSRARNRRQDSGFSSSSREVNDLVVLDSVGNVDGESVTDLDPRSGRKEEGPPSSPSSSLSLSPSPSPERVVSPLDDGPQRRRSHRERSPSPPRRRPSSRNSASRRDSWGRHSDQKPLPRQEASDHFRRRGTAQSSARSDGANQQSWESKVEAFMKAIDSKPSSSSDKLEEKNDSGNPPPPGVDPSEAEEDIKMTPLIRYVGQRLKQKKNLKLRLEGPFKYSLLSLLSQHEWVAAKSIELLHSAGFTEDRLIFSATTVGGLELEAELKSAVFTGKIGLGNKPELVAQVLRVIECIVKYFTAKDENGHEDNEGEGSRSAEKASPEDERAAKPVRTSVGQTLMQLAMDSAAAERVDEASDRPSSHPETETVGSGAGDVAQPVNSWAVMWDRMQWECMDSFKDLKTFLAKDMLRLRDETLCRHGSEFEVAQLMVAGLVAAGFGLDSLKKQVMHTQTDDILPPRDVVIVDKGDRVTRKKYLYDVLRQRVAAATTAATTDPAELSNEQINYLTRKALIYAMRGCNKMPTPTTNPAGSCNVVFNYLPPGLREMESSARKGDADAHEKVLDDGQTPQATGIVLLDPEDMESTDPLNAILHPPLADPSKADELPKRKYLMGFVHSEWVVLNGRPQVYEISVYMSDLTNQELFIIPAALQKQADTMENLGFVANPDRHEFYYAKVGVGCFKALETNKAVEKLVQFLEEKRNATSENANNGLVLVFYSEEEMSIIARLIEDNGHKNIYLDSVKGFGCLEHYIEKNRSKKLVYLGPKLNVGTECFYNTEAKKGLQFTNLVSRCKAEAVCQALEYFLDEQPSYANFIQICCFPALGKKMDAVMKKLRQMEEMYTLEVFVAAQLKNQMMASRYQSQSQMTLQLDGVYQPVAGHDFRDKPTIVASRFCRMLVQAGFDKAALTKCFRQNSEFTINSNVILETMSMSQRLAVMDQTMRCIHSVQMYFRPNVDNAASMD